MGDIQVSVRWAYNVIFYMSGTFTRKSGHTAAGRNIQNELRRHDAVGIEFNMYKNMNVIFWLRITRTILKMPSSGIYGLCKNRRFGNRRKASVVSYC
jgi:hypothetical protein